MISKSHLIALCLRFLNWKMNVFEYDGPFPFQQAMIPSTVKKQVGSSIQELLIESDPFNHTQC